MNVGRWVASATFAGTMLLGLGVLIVVLLVQHLRLQQPMSDQQNSMVMLKGAWKIPLETIHCVSRSSKRKTMILDKDYSGDPRVATLFGDAFGVGPARVDDASCMFVDFNAIGHSDQAVRLYGRAAVVLGSVGVCEWRAPPDPDGNSCSDKKIYFFRESEALELLKLSLDRK